MLELADGYTLRGVQPPYDQRRILQEDGIMRFLTFIPADSNGNTRGILEAKARQLVAIAEFREKHFYEIEKHKHFHLRPGDLIDAACDYASTAGWERFAQENELDPITSGIIFYHPELGGIFVGRSETEKLLSRAVFRGIHPKVAKGDLLRGNVQEYRLFRKSPLPPDIVALHDPEFFPTEEMLGEESTSHSNDRTTIAAG